MTEEQKQAILARDYLKLQKLGGNVYYFSKIFFTDKKSVQYGSAQMAGMAEEDYKAMMVAGGRDPGQTEFSEGNDNG